MVRTILSLIIFSFLISCSKPEESLRTEKEIKPVKTMVIKEETLYKKIVDNSDLDPLKQTSQISESEGEIIAINYKNGDIVNKGEKIILLENQDITSRLQSSKGDYINKKSQLEKIEKFSKNELLNEYQKARADYLSSVEELSAAEKNFNEKEVIFAGIEQLYKERLVSQKEYLEAASTYEQSKSSYFSLRNSGVKEKEENYKLYQKYIENESWKYDIERARSDYKSALAEYNAAQRDFRGLQVTAKISGVIADMDLNLYDHTDKDSFLFRILDDSTMKGSIGIPSEDISGISLGKEVRVYLNGISSELIGKIHEINPAADMETKKFQTKIVMGNKSGILKKGMYSKIVLETDPQKGLTVPKEAIMIKDLLNYIAIVKNEKAKIIQVKVGRESEKSQEVISSDIQKGDRVVIQGQYLLENEDVVREVE